MPLSPRPILPLQVGNRLDPIFQHLEQLDRLSDFVEVRERLEDPFHDVDDKVVAERRRSVRDRLLAEVKESRQGLEQVQDLVREFVVGEVTVVLHLVQLAQPPRSGIHGYRDRQESLTLVNRGGGDICTDVGDRDAEIGRKVATHAGSDRAFDLFRGFTFISAILASSTHVP